MTKSDIVIVTLAPMRVVSAYGFGESPELIALAKLHAFAERKGLLVAGALPPTYGFNNPNPTPGSPNYGYEAWLPVAEQIEPDGDMQVVNFPGGRYAVMRSRGIENIGSDWQELAKWRETTHFLAGKHQWLEKLLTPLDSLLDRFELDLYLPIAG